MDDALFIHLPVTSAEVLNGSFGSGPQPYDPSGGYQPLEQISEWKKVEPVQSEQIVDEGVAEGDRFVERSLQNIMFEFIDSNKRHEWPNETAVHCWWCCGQFKTPPCAIPKSFSKGVFYLYGCFCSYNCAAAYNFDKKGDLMWESHSLLHLLYKKLHGEAIERIVPAPPKEILTMFGGEMTREEYRELLVTNRYMYRIIEPPMVSIIPKLESNNLNLEKIRNKRKYIPLSAMDDFDDDDAGPPATEEEPSEPVAKKTLQDFFVGR